MAETLRRVVELAVETIDGCDFAGVVLHDDHTLTTPVHTDPIVVELDTLQHHHQEGPCLDVLADRTPVYVDDLAADARWPRFGPRATAIGVRSALALSLSAVGTRGALNLYARHPRSFGVVDRAKGLLLAGLAGQSLSTARVRDEETRRLDNLQGALVSRAVIGQAQGILIERERVTPDQAFDLLRRASQHLNMKLRDVAQALVDTGESLQTGSPPPRR